MLCDAFIRMRNCENAGFFNLNRKWMFLQIFANLLFTCSSVIPAFFEFVSPKFIYSCLISEILIGIGNFTLMINLNEIVK